MTLPSPLHHPAQGQIKLAPSQWGTGTVWKGFSFLFPSLDLPGSSCLSRLPACVLQTMLVGGPSRSGTRGAGAPTPSQYLTLRFVFYVRPQAQTDGSSPS